MREVCQRRDEDRGVCQAVQGARGRLESPRPSLRDQLAQVRRPGRGLHCIRGRLECIRVGVKRARGRFAPSRIRRSRPPGRLASPRARRGSAPARLRAPRTRRNWVPGRDLLELTRVAPVPARLRGSCRRLLRSRMHLRECGSHLEDRRSRRRGRQPRRRPRQRGARARQPGFGWDVVPSTPGPAAAAAHGGWGASVRNRRHFGRRVSVGADSRRG